MFVAREAGTYKENVHPRAVHVEAMKTGYTSGGHMDSQGSRALEESHVLEQQAAFEAELTSGASADPVRVWSEYASWAAKHRPEERVAVIARACNQLTQDPKLHDDIRLLRLWIRLADEQKKVETHTFFGSLLEDGIGRKHALFYEAWATAYEAKRMFTEADTVYRTGIKCSAQPLDRLRKRYAEFERRMAKRQTRKMGTRCDEQTRQKTRTVINPQCEKQTRQKARTVASPQCVQVPQAPGPMDLPNTCLSGSHHEEGLPTSLEELALLGAAVRMQHLNPDTAHANQSEMTRAVPEPVESSEELPEESELFHDSHWALRKVPADRSIRDSHDREFREDGNCDGRPSKRRLIATMPTDSSPAPAKSSAPSVWSMASWLPFRKRAC